VELEYTGELDFHYDDLWDSLIVKSEDELFPYESNYRKREAFTKKYAWAIPTVAALECLAKYGPLVEVGAGTGYWAYELRKLGVTIDAYDQYPPDGSEWTEEELDAYAKDEAKHPDKSWYHRGMNAWTEVLQGTPETLKTYDATWNLFLCWPPYSTKMAVNTLLCHRGEFVCYVGEGMWGCNGTDEFFRLLERRYDEVEHESIPQWPGIHDHVTIYKRKGR
jgi:hypothetical protein